MLNFLKRKHDGGMLAVFEFPSREAIHAFCNSSTYAPVEGIRCAAASLDIWAVQGFDA
jgi:uncharacterized protein (DUF1330 family)